MDAFQVDELKLYLRDEIKIADGVVLRCPTIGEIANYGESKYFHVAQMLCSTPSSMKVFLADNKLDWMQVSDFELFTMLCRLGAFSKENTGLLLGDLDLSSFKLYQFGEDDFALSNKDSVAEGENPIIINQVIYDILITYVRKMHNFKKQVDKAGNSITKKVLIDLARQDEKMAAKKPYKSFLRPLISAVKCRQGYSIDYVKDMGIFEFMDDVARLNVIVQADAALQGMYSGFVDTKKMDKTVLDWMREIQEESNTKNKSILKEGAN